MRKLYLTLLTAFLLTAVSFGQRKVANHSFVKKSITNPIIFSPLGSAGACDTLNLDEAEDWSNAAYYSTDVNEEINGFICGVNGWGDQQKANYFDASATTYNYLSGVFLAFYIANSNTSANLSKNVIFRVYDDADGQPGNELTTTETAVQLPLSQIKADIDGKRLTEVTFSTPIPLPASKKFYVSVDISNFQWTGAIMDSISMWSTEDGDIVPNQAWEYTDLGEGYQWYDMNVSWNGFKVALFMFPYLNTDASGSCEALPVHLLSFNSQRHNNDVMLNWQIADEIGMKGYEVQKSANNGAYSTITFVPALNNAKNQAYSITDKNAFSSSATVQYRLKQIDGDGSVKYSRVLQVKSGSAINEVVFANPFSGALKLNLNLASTQKVSVYVYDMQGRLVASLPQKMYDASANNLVVQGTDNLKPGLYSVKVIAGSEQKVYKAMKQ